MKISKLPSWRGLQKNHAQLPKHHTKIAVSFKKLFKRVLKRVMRELFRHTSERP